MSLVLDAPRGRDPFIPSRLDDLGLDPFAFRVLCHAWRRAGRQGRMTEAMANVGRACGMSERRVRLALLELRARGLLQMIRGSQGGRGVAPVYAPVPPEAWPPQQPAEGAVTLHEVQGKQASTLHHVPKTLHHVPKNPAPGADKGTPLKVLQEGKANPAPHAGIWTDVAVALRGLMISEEEYATWCRPLSAQISGNVLRVRAPGQLHHAYWMRRADVLACAARQAGLACSVVVEKGAAL